MIEYSFGEASDRLDVGRARCKGAMEGQYTYSVCVEGGREVVAGRVSMVGTELRT